MSSTNLEIVFEGPAVKTGTIDARLLAESLLGYSEVFARANAIVNGDELSRAAVLVQSDFKHGSFIAALEFVQNFTEQAAHLITAHNFFSAVPIAGAIGFLSIEFGKELAKDLAKETVVGLFKWLKGKRPDDVTPAGEHTVEIRKGEESKIVNVNAFNMYGDSAIRAGLDKVTSPLRQAEIDRITVKQDGKEQAVFEKSEAGSIASGFSRRAPLLAIITGSMTRGPSLWLEIAAATASMISALASIPVFTASQPMEREVRANLVYRAFARIGGAKVPDAKTMARPG